MHHIIIAAPEVLIRRSFNTHFDSLNYLCDYHNTRVNTDHTSSKPLWQELGLFVDFVNELNTLYEAF